MPTLTCSGDPSDINKIVAHITSYGYCIIDVEYRIRIVNDFPPVDDPYYFFPISEKHNQIIVFRFFNRDCLRSDGSLDYYESQALLAKVCEITKGDATLESGVHHYKAIHKKDNKTFIRT